MLGAMVLPPKGVRKGLECVEMVGEGAIVSSSPDERGLELLMCRLGGARLSARFRLGGEEALAA